MVVVSLGEERSNLQMSQNTGLAVSCVCSVIARESLDEASSVGDFEGLFSVKDGSLGRTRLRYSSLADRPGALTVGDVMEDVDVEGTNLTRLRLIPAPKTL